MTKLGVFWPADSRNRTIAYWIATMLLAAENVLGGIWDVARIPYVRTDVVQLGFPVYVLTILGTWKLLVLSRSSYHASRDSRNGPTPGCSSTTAGRSPHISR